MAARTGARDRARARKRASKMLDRAETHLSQAKAAKSCKLRVEHATEALEAASFASCEASGYRTARLRRALNTQTAARQVIIDCTRKR